MISLNPNIKQFPTYEKVSFKQNKQLNQYDFSPTKERLRQLGLCTQVKQMMAGKGPETRSNLYGQMQEIINCVKTPFRTGELESLKESPDTLTSIIEIIYKVAKKDISNIPTDPDKQLIELSGYFTCRHYGDATKKVVKAAFEYNALIKFISQHVKK